MGFCCLLVSEKVYRGKYIIGQVLSLSVNNGLALEQCWAEPMIMMGKDWLVEKRFTCVAYQSCRWISVIKLLQGCCTDLEL